MSNISKEFCDTTQEISKGMRAGALASLKEKFPNKYKAINDKLDNNFTQDGIKEFKNSIIKGFKKIDMWVEI